MPIGETTAAAIIGAGATLGNMGFQAGATKRQREWLEKMWHMSNEWNLPANQVNRMREAGLNPKLMYGTGSSGGGTTSPPASYQKPEYGLPDLLGLITSVKDIKIKENQADYIEAQTESEKVNRALIVAKEVLTTKQYEDLTAEIMGKDAYTGDGKQETNRYQRIKAESQKAVQDAEIRKLEKELEEKMVKWFESGQLAKYIPLIRAVFGK